MKRKVVQVAVAQCTFDVSVAITYFALCNDGTMWERREDEREWRPVPAVPGCVAEDPGAAMRREMVAEALKKPEKRKPVAVAKKKGR